MKLWKPLSIGTAALCTLATVNAPAENLGPGQIDFGNFNPPHNGGEFVEVNLTSTIIGFAASLVEKEDAELAKLIRGVQLVKVNVIGLDEQNRGELEKRVQRIRKEMDSKGWERVVTARQKDQDVGVYLKTQGQQVVQGLVVTVLDGNKQAVFINVVGDIKPEQLSLIGEKLHIDALKNAGHHVDAERGEK